MHSLHPSNVRCAHVKTCRGDPVQSILFIRNVLHYSY